MHAYLFSRFGDSTASPPYPWVPHPWIQPTVDQKYLKKIPEISKTQNLNLLCASNRLHSICIVLGIISNLEMI